jgi:hypothetical protein
MEDSPVKRRAPMRETLASGSSVVGSVFDTRQIYLHLGQAAEVERFQGLPVDVCDLAYRWSAGPGR